ncbi:MAG: PD-(D/E)XK nuclease family protein [Clostridia bacterium]|nr:PD-(D/E)XK nuclease family protein [Clostridia bacterium]
MNNFDKSFMFIKSKNIIESYKLTAKIISENFNQNFAVFNKNIKDYDGILSNVLENYKINFNRDYGISITDSQISNLIFSCLNFLISGITKKNIFDFLSSCPKNFSDDEILEFKNYCNIYNINDFNSNFVVDLHKKFIINNETLDSIENTRNKILDFFDNLKKNTNNFGFFKSIINISQDKFYKKNKNYDIFINILKSLNLKNSYTNNFFEIKNVLREKFQNIKILPDKKNQVSLISDIENYSPLRKESIFLLIKNCDELTKYEKIIEKFDKKYIIFLEDKNLKFNIINSENFFEQKISKSNFMKNTKFNIEFFNNRIDLNISQIENYYKCSIFFLFSSILKIENKRKFSFDALEYGSLVHSVLEKYLKNFYNLNNKLNIKKIVEEYMLNKFSLIYSKYKLDYMINKISENLIFIIDKILKINQKDDFIPSEFEVKINRKIKLENNFFINLNGKIDRIDIDKKNKKIRIIDYKTGKKKFDFNDILYGTDLQAAIYLNSYNIEGYEKSGAFYFSTKKPLINIDYNQNDIEKKIENSFFYQGISTENLDNNKNIFKLDKTQMDIMLKYSDFMIKQAVRNILNGEIYKNPKNFLNNNFGCEVCEYKNICKNFNVNFIKTKRYKKIEEIINIMCEKLEHEYK